MEYRRLGDTGLRVSALSIGGWLTFGGKVDDATARDILRCAVEHGVNLIDVADSYAIGGAERAVGACIGEFRRIQQTDDAVAAPFAPEPKKDVQVPSLAPQVVNKDGSTSPAKPADKPADKPAGDAKVGTGSDGKTTEKPADPAKPTKINGTLKIDIEPEEAAKIAKVTIEGKDIDGVAYELDMTEQFKAATKDLKPDAKKPEVKKDLKIVVKASGYRDFTGKVDVVADASTTFKVTMQKRSSGGNVGGLPRPPPPGGFTRPPPPSGGQKCKKPPCGLIDI